jgi:hypothetical protein
MKNKTGIHSVIVLLGLKQSPVSALIVRSTNIHDAMVANAKMFPLPPITLVQVKADIDALGTAEIAMKTRTQGTRVLRDDKRKIVVADMRQLHAYVQQLANASPDQAALIASNAAMTLRNPPTFHKSDLAAKTLVPGSLKVSAKAVIGARAHEWQISTDGGKTWADLPTTAQSSTTVHGLLSASMVMLRHRPVLKTGVGAWSQAFTTVVS